MYTNKSYWRGRSEISCKLWCWIKAESQLLLVEAALNPLCCEFISVKILKCTSKGQEIHPRNRHSYYWSDSQPTFPPNPLGCERQQDSIFGVTTLYYRLSWQWYFLCQVIEQWALRKINFVVVIRKSPFEQLSDIWKKKSSFRIHGFFQLSIFLYCLSIW